MSEEPFDQLNFSIEEKNRRNKTLILSVVLCILFLVGGLFGFSQFVGFLNAYFKLRNKLVAFEAVSVSLAVSWAFLPFIAFAGWIRRIRKGRKANYFLFLVLTLLSYSVFLMLGMELVMGLGLKTSNPLLPAAIIFAPFQYYFDLLFLLTSFLSFGLLRIFTRRK